MGWFHCVCLRPVPEVVWRSDSSRYELRDENLTLVIDNVQLADQHKYTCSAHNSEGATPESTINIVVHGGLRFCVHASLHRHHRTEALGFNTHFPP